MPIIAKALPVALGILLAASCASTPAGTTAVRQIPEGAPLVALTFDDGPDTELTPLVLEKLEKYGVPATFFLVGQRIDEDTAPVLARMKADGCEMGNHSWSYQGLDKADAATIKDSVGRTQEAIIKYGKMTPRFFRAPNLAVSPTLFGAVDLTFAGGGAIGMDWGGCNTDAKQRADNVLRATRDGSIVLLHDVQAGFHPTPEALDIIIPALKAKGYVFVTLSELFQAKGVALDPAEDTQWGTVF